MEKKYDLIGFGEAMVRFNAPNHSRLEQSSSLQMAVAAAELNVAVNTSKLGLKTAWVSKLVDTWSGHYIINKGREHGVDMSEVILTPFMGVGSEVFSPVSLGRKAIGIELKDSYYKQAIKNLKEVNSRFLNDNQQKLF